MALLLLFAVLAGAGTAISPCVLPILPALLSAGATGGRRRPLGIVLGLSVTFTITIVGLAEVVDGVGLGDGTLRTVAVIVLLGFGVLLLVPRLADRVEAALSPIIALGPRTGGHGFASGLVVGAALGFVYAPCAGPILAAVISVSAASGSTVAVAIAYSAGSAAVLLVLCLGGRRVVERIRAAGRGPWLQRAMGVVMIVTALAVASDADVRFQTAIADDLPGFLVNPTGSLERSSAVEQRLDDLRGPSRFAAKQDGLPELGAAPDFQGVTRWLNSRPLTLKDLRGKVVLVDFWTYTCINCLRTLPYLRAWDERYRDRGLTIVGVHTPEFAFEKDSGNVRDAIARNRLRYAVAQDNDFGTWEAWSNQYWPAKYLIDANGQVRYAHFGEGDYGVTERRSGRCWPRPGPARSARVRGASPARCRAGRPRRRRTSARRAPGLARATGARRARLRGAFRRAAGEPLRARRALEGGRRVGRGRARRDADRARHRQVRLPRARVARHASRGTSTCWSTANLPGTSP